MMSDAGGARGFPNLKDDDWSWGGSPDQIKVSIANGRRGNMPSQAHLGEEKIDQVTAYVMSLAGRDVDAAKAAAGKEVFMTAGCIGCHGDNYSGGPIPGMPLDITAVGAEERIEAALQGAEVDRVPISLWKHYHLQDRAPKQLAEVKVMLHSCGGIRPLLPGLIEAGLDIMQPVQTTSAGMDAQRLKREFGQGLCLWGGGCNTQMILPRATPDEVAADVRQRVEIMAPGGGFVFQQIHNVMADVLPELADLGVELVPVSRLVENHRSDQQWLACSSPLRPVAKN